MANVAQPAVQAPAVAPAPVVAPATLSSWETGVNTYMVEFISDYLVDVKSYFGMKAGETMMNVVKAVALVFASLLLMPLAALGWMVSKLKACCSSTATPAQPGAPPAQQQVANDQQAAQQQNANNQQAAQQQNANNQQAAQQQVANDQQAAQQQVANDQQAAQPGNQEVQPPQGQAGGNAQV